MKKLILILLATSISLLPLSARNDTAEELFNNGDYSAAYTEYAQLIRRDSRDYMAKYKAARCLIAMKRYSEAVPLLEYVAKKRLYKAYLYLYQCHYAMYRFDDAIAAIDLYIGQAKLTDTEIQQYTALADKAKEARRMFQNSDCLQVADSQKIHKNQLLTAYHLSPSLGRLFYLQNDTLGQTVGYETGRADKRIEVQTLDSQKVLTLSLKLMDKWGEPSPISEKLATNANCNYPFEMPDGITLYYASNGNNTLGGYDIFMTRTSQATNTYTEPLNIGMPYNSPDNDYLLVVDDLAQRAWFATDRRQHPDTVVVYEFVTGTDTKIPDTIPLDTRRRIAQLLEYNIVRTVQNHTIHHSNASTVKASGINFVISDNITYHSIDDFKNPQAKTLYQEYETLLRRRQTNAILLQGKRREYNVSTSETDKAILRNEVLSLEADLMQMDTDIKAQIRKIRLLELTP